MWCRCARCCHVRRRTGNRHIRGCHLPGVTVILAGALCAECCCVPTSGSGPLRPRCSGSSTCSASCARRITTGAGSTSSTSCFCPSPSGGFNDEAGGEEFELEAWRGSTGHG